jgi:5-(carboxyamino)imidazole ribonucleotide synthase
MMAEAAAPLGVDVVALDPTPDCPASVAADQVVADFDDADGIADLADRVDALTFEIELADPDAMAVAADEAGVVVHPDPDTLRTIQDKLVQNDHFAEAGVPLPDYRRVDDAAALREVVDDWGRVMLKARTGGYDGRGNLPVSDPDDAASALDVVGADDGGAIAERFVDFVREISVIGVRGRDEVRTYPVGENVHEAEILRETVVPARSDRDVRERADEVAREVLAALDGRGVYGIELFETADGDILLNEVAPRPHNSGHWTIEGAATSQFEQHVRAVLGWPLGSAELRDTSVSANVLGDVEEPASATLRGVETVLESDAALHWYGKREVRPLRKMGHLTLAADEPREELLAAARRLRDSLTFQP